MPLVQVPQTLGTGVMVVSGSGSPEGIITASIGSLYLQVDGSRGQTLWRKYSGTASTGWSLIDDFVLNVLDFGAKGDGVTDDTAAIQAAIDLANTLAYASVYIPAKDANNGYIFTQLKYYAATRIIGDGVGGTFGGSRGTWLYQKSGTALEMLIPSNTATQHIGLYLQDIGFSAFSNTASNTGGVRLESCAKAHLVRVQVTWANVFGFHVKAGAVGGDAMYNSFFKCVVENLNAAGINFLFESSAASQPDGNVLLDCRVNSSSSTWIKVEGTVSRGCDTLRVIGCSFLGTSSTTALDMEGTQAQFIGNRFELIPVGTITVNITPAGGTTSPSMFVGNSWAAPSGLTFNDVQAGVRRSTRIAEFTTNGVVNHIPGPEFEVAPVTYSASMTPNTENGITTIVATNGTAFTINSPTNRRTGRITTYDIKNSSGGAMGVITWNAVYKLAGAAFTNPANGLRRTITFYDDGTNLVELNRASADI